MSGTTLSPLGKILLSLLLVVILLPCFIWLDQYQLNSDFKDLKSMLKEVRHEAFISKATFEIRFEGKTVKVENKKTAKEIYRLYFPTLHKVDYETTEGNGKIIMTPWGTDQYNIHRHGGNITMRSWLGRERHIWVHCTALPTEGIMTDKTLRSR